MKFSRERILALAILALALLANAIALWPETAISRVDLNDNVFHYTLIERIVQTLQNGGNPLDCWSPEWALGYPVLRTYQPLAHLLVAFLYFALGKSLSLMTLFVWIRFLSVALLPLSFFVAAQCLGLTPLAAAAASALAPLVSTNFLYGVEYGSFTWAGSGLFPQAVATHLLVLSLGLGRQAIREGRRIIAAGILVGLTLVSHFIYGYMAAISLLLLALLPDREIPRPVRLRRTLAAGAVAFAISAFQLVPLIADAVMINHSRWEPTWKWDSFGASTTLARLFTGELLDHGRLPILTLLAFCGVGLVLWKLRRKKPCAAEAFLAAGAAFWILLYFGRSFWGPLPTLLGVASDMHLHRVVAGGQIFLVFLAATALAEGWRSMAARWHVAAVAAATALLFYPMVRERGTYLAQNAAWGRRNLAAYHTEQRDIEASIAEARQRGGRAYAGLAAGWGAQFKVGDVPFYAFLSEAQVPAVAFLYHSMGLAGDVMVRFNDRNAAQYRLFNIRTVIAPVSPTPPSPDLLAPRQRFGRFQTYEAPGGGYFDLIDVTAAVKTTARNFYDINDRWLSSAWPAQHTHLLLDWRHDAPPGIPRIEPEAALPAILSGAPLAGSVLREQDRYQDYRAECDILRPTYVLFKMAWHPNWKAYVDGIAQPVAMVSPGFSAVSVPAGRHRVEFRYEPGAAKLALAFAGIFIVLLLGLFGQRIGAALASRFPERIPRPVLVPAGLFALSLPVMIPLFTSAVLAGHDSFEYFPRIVETQQNLAHGTLLLRWAPDLGHGYGQPLFIFHPPFFYWIAELWHLFGCSPVTSVNLACALLVLAAAAAMFRLGRLYFGATGGWLAAAAYLYAPYFAVDLYVRSALEEFTALPLFALALYGFGAFARQRKRRHWIIGSAAYAALLCTHFPAALLFTPLLLAFLGFTAWMEKSRWILGTQTAGLAAGLCLSAWAWLPGIAEKPYVSMNRLTQGAFHYALHFVYPRQLLDSPWGYGYSLPGPADGMSFALGWSHLLLAVAATVWLARRGSVSGKRWIAFFAIAAAALCYCMVGDSAWLWQRLPLLSYVDYPWRLLGPTAACLAMAVAALAPALDALRAWRVPALTLAFALLIVPNLSHLHPPREADIDLSFWTPHQLAARGFESTTTGEVTPRWMSAVPPYDPQAVFSAGTGQFRQLERTPFRWSDEVTTATPARILLPIAYYPGWSVAVDGRTAEISPSPVTGLIECAVPAGAHEVTAAWGLSPARQTGEGISLLALAAMVIVGLRRRKVHRSSAVAA
jgi:uncharacterized membrane protein